MRRSLWVLFHRYLGLSLAAFLMLSGGSGAIIAFERELDAALNPDLHHIDAPPQAPLELERLTSAVEQVFPGTSVRSIEIPTARNDAVVLRLHAKPGTDRHVLDELFINPYDGAILGARQRKAAKFDRRHVVPMIREFHESLYLDDLGEILLGVVASIWLASGLIGLYLTFPRGTPFFKKWGIAWSVSSRRLNFDIHRAGGLWWLGIFVLISASGAYLALDKTVFRPLASQANLITMPPGKWLPRKIGATGVHLSFDVAVDMASRQLPAAAAGYSASKVHHLADQRVFRVEFSRPINTGWLHLPPEEVFLDDVTGARVAGYGFLQGTPTDKVLMLQLPIHSGKIVGTAGQAIIMVGGIMTVAMSVTGLVIWWRRRQARISTAAMRVVKQPSEPV